MTQMSQTVEVATAHQDLHSEQGAQRGEHPGRAKNPVIKARGLAWLEFEKQDLDRTEMFARDFKFTQIIFIRIYVNGSAPGAYQVEFTDFTALLQE